MGCCGRYSGEGGVVSLLTRQGSWEPDKQDDAVCSIVMSPFHYVVIVNLI